MKPCFPIKSACMGKQAFHQPGWNMLVFSQSNLTPNLFIKKLVPPPHSIYSVGSRMFMVFYSIYALGHNL